LLLHNIAVHYLFIYLMGQRCTTLMGQGPQCIIFGALEGRRKIYDLNLRKSIPKTENKIYLISLL